MSTPPDTTALTLPFPALPPTAPDVLQKLFIAQDRLLEIEQVPIQTDHVIHGGMYARTVTIPPGVLLIGALVKVPTVLITVGSALVLVGKDWAEVDGYQVLPGSAGRKQMVLSRGPCVFTMMFPTKAKTVEEAEEQFTDEHELLLSRKQDLDSVVITGE